jgi:hypothetical protein
MTRVAESILGSLVAAVFTRSFVVAAVIGVVLFVSWEVHDYGFLGAKTDVMQDETESEDHDDPQGQEDAGEGPA